MAKPGSRSNARRSRFEAAANRVQTKAASLADDIAEFEEFRATTLKAIRKDIKRGMNGDEIIKKYLAILKGRLVSDALTTDDPALANSIIKELTDRVVGKAVEKKEIKHHLENVSDKELDAILKSEEQELEDMQKRFEKQ